MNDKKTIKDTRPSDWLVFFGAVGAVLLFTTSYAWIPIVLFVVLFLVWAVVETIETVGWKDAILVLFFLMLAVPFGGAGLIGVLIVCAIIGSNRKPKTEQTIIENKTMNVYTTPQPTSKSNWTHTEIH